MNIKNRLGRAGTIVAAVVALGVGGVGLGAWEKFTVTCGH